MFVGVDLAWSRNNPSGVAVLSDDEEPRVLSADTVVEDEEILDAVTQDSCLVAVDAPLVVPNETGQRPAEDELRPVYAEFDAGPYPANRSWLERVCGEVRGETLVSKLRNKGFDHNASVDTSVDQGIIEVYPHPAMVALFDLSTVIPYKDKQGRSKADQLDGLRTYYEYLCESRIVESSMPSFPVSLEDTKKDIKAFEDVLDGVFSAYIAWYAWNHPDRMRVFGSEEGGYITSPELNKTYKKS